MKLHFTICSEIQCTTRKVAKVLSFAASQQASTAPGSSHRRILVFALVAGLGMALALRIGYLRWTGPADPVFQGVRTSKWFEKFCESIEPALLGRVTNSAALEAVFSTPRILFGVQENRGAQAAFSVLGSEVVPFMASVLSERDNSIRRTYARVYPELPDRMQLWLPRPRPAHLRRVCALAILRFLNADIDAAKPALLRLLNSPVPPMEQEWAATALTRCPISEAELLQQLQLMGDHRQVASVEAILRLANQWGVNPETLTTKLGRR
jgi:hypothetical protein